MATLSENIMQAISDFDSIQTAIINKGVDVPYGTPTSQYSNKIEQIEGGIPDDREWRPDPKWVTMPPMPPDGEQKIYCIIAVRKEYPVYAVYATTSTGQYRVDWGDGVVTLHNSGTLAEYTYDYDSVTSEVTDLEYKTALVTITSVTSNALRTLDFSRSHSSDIRTNKSSPLLFMQGRIPYVTNYTVGVSSTTATTWRNIFMEAFNMHDTNYLTTALNMLHTSTSLQWFPQFDGRNIPSYNNFMYGCTSIRKVPKMNLSSVTAGNISNLYANNTQIRIIDEFNTGNSNGVLTVFQGCTNLEIIRNFICPNVVLVDNAFSGCYSLRILRVTMGNATTSFNVSNTALNRDALVDLFSDLYDRSDRSVGTVTITGCLGAALLTAADRLIATAKNWTIVS